MSMPSLSYSLVLDESETQYLIDMIDESEEEYGSLCEDDINIKDKLLKHLDKFKGE